MLPDEQRPSAPRTERDVVWSTGSQGYKCIHCGQPAMLFADGTALCLTMSYGEECQTAEELEDELRDCAPEGHTYAVFGADV